MDANFGMLKTALFNDGIDALEMFTQLCIDTDDKDVIDNLLDEVVENMPKERLHWYYRKYGLPYDEKTALGHCGC